jgi:extradiol dioxygenase family protein
METRFQAAPSASSEIRLESVTPVLRIFDAARAREFYVDFLGFQWDWEQRLFDQAPVYAQVSRAGLVLHLSEHHGDGSPGVALIVAVSDVVAFHRELEARNYTRAVPALTHSEAEGLTLQVFDPFGNRIRFRELRS